MSTQQQAQEYCLTILSYLYDQRQQDSTAQLSIARVAEALNYDEPSTTVIVEDLRESDLVASEEGGDEVFLTALGLDVIGRYRSNKNITPLQYGDVRDESMTNSLPDQVDILLPETHGVVKVTFPAVADALRSAVPDLDLSDAQGAELEADIHTIETQLKSPRPKTQVLVQCYRAIELTLNEVDDQAGVNELIRSVKSLMA